MVNLDNSSLFEFCAIHYPFYEKRALVITEDGSHSIEDYCRYIQRHQIESADIAVSDLTFLKDCVSLKHIHVTPSWNATDAFSFSPLYSLPLRSLHCINSYGSTDQYKAEIDYSHFHELEELTTDVNAATHNFHNLPSLKSLIIGGFDGENRDLSDLFCSEQLDTLRLIEGQFHSLNGIERSKRMQCVYLQRNRGLRDISALRTCKHTLKTLRIENCPKIEDFSVLGELEQLELLHLTGSNVLPDLDFLNHMKNLKTFVFNVNILDGDLSPCLRLSYVSLGKNRKHYNLKDKDLPKGPYIRGNETIETWRRLE